MVAPVNTHTEARYGRWTIIDPNERGAFVHCRCDCGTERRIQRSKLIQGNTKSCGCYRSDVLRDLTFPNLAPHRDPHVIPGARFGRWTVLGHPESAKNRVALCQCDCGTQRKVVVSHLLSGKTKSCGCLKRDGGRAKLLNRA